jgi:N-formylglutamate deformylase
MINYKQVVYTRYVSKTMINQNSTGKIFQLTQGNVPLLISMPHNGEAIPDDIAATMTEKALTVPDTDWYIDKLYDFAEQLGIYVIKPVYSRYVIDLNRSKNNENLYPGANSTELCPTTAFDLSPLYLAGKNPDKAEVERRITLYWQPYHQALASTLADLKKQYGKAVLLDAHSILSQVPRFFTDTLPDFNIGNADGKSCASSLIEQVSQLDLTPYSSVINGRFKGGYITRAYGQPEKNIHAIQLELSQRTYLKEPTNQYLTHEANKVKIKLQAFVQCLVNFAQQ